MCNNYDSFALEEDGRIDVQIAQEYAELNLSNPPAIVRSESPLEALKRIRGLEDEGISGEKFDLIILVYSAGGNEVWDFAAEAKGLLPNCPIVLSDRAAVLLQQGDVPPHGAGRQTPYRLPV